jgi:hypothetical protein
MHTSTEPPGIAAAGAARAIPVLGHAAADAGGEAGPGTAVRTGR